jgi:sugar phosphate isomerase/epimerase
MLDGIQPDESNKFGEENFGFRAVGYGVQNMPAIVQAAVDAGAKWMVVEQDNPGPGKTSIESIEMSIQYLKTLKF